MGFKDASQVADVAMVGLTTVRHEVPVAVEPLPVPPVPPPTPVQDAQDATVETTGADPPPE